MRHNVAISTLLASLIGLSAADETGEFILREGGLGAGTSPSQVVSFQAPITPAIISLDNYLTTTFPLEANNVMIDTVTLRIYNTSGSNDGSDDLIFITESDQSLPEGKDTRLTFYSNSVVVEWGLDHDYLDKPLYLECEWNNASSRGTSTSQIFVVFDTDQQKAMETLQQTGKAGDSSAGAPPARDQVINSSPSPPPSTTTLATTSSTAQTSQPAATIGLETPSPAPNGLSKGGIIGVAVGASVAGLLIAGALAWLFCIHRRRRRRHSRLGNTSTTHHMMQSYGSDVGARTLMPDKEIPVVHESRSQSQSQSQPPSPQSVYDGRPSADLYAPYSDRSAASPVPPPPHPPHPQPHHHDHDHRRAASSMSTTTAAAAATGATTSETDLSWTRGAPTPTSVIASRYAHLVEEGMTEDEIRRLEDEERQLDAAIEHAERGATP
ncbi:hypothetical protein F5Y12DRAFT_2951 [Xylaria sp. FL1777]|nr:hypothetical protein F5Y12DRAFT_2951 [Xylaria sp. FL1777]